MYLHLSYRVTSVVSYYSVFLLLLAVKLFLASTIYCLSCASFLKDVSHPVFGVCATGVDAVVLQFS
jgi:hypothetical protein